MRISVGRRVWESILIIMVGIFEHINGYSMLSIFNPTLQIFAPNAASLAFTISILILLSISRPLWTIPRLALGHVPELGVFTFELLIILYIMDLTMCIVWVPILNLLDYLLANMSNFMLELNNSYLVYKTPRLAAWLRDDAFYCIRFLLAFSFLLCMLHIVGVTTKFRRYAKFIFNCCYIKYMPACLQRSCGGSKKRLIKISGARKRRNPHEPSDVCNDNENDDNNTNFADVSAGIPYPRTVNIGHHSGEATC